MRVFIIEDSGIIYYDQHWSTANAFVLLMLHICFCCWKRDLLHVRLLLFHFWRVYDLFFSRVRYPIYHIPARRNVKDLASFLTYHTISSSFQGMC